MSLIDQSSHVFRAPGKHGNLWSTFLLPQMAYDDAIAKFLRDGGAP